MSFDPQISSHHNTWTVQGGTATETSPAIEALETKHQLLREELIAGQT
jgi:hypothetical protein